MSYLLIHGDARKLPVDPGSVDAIITDPPYGIVNKFGTNVGNGTRTLQFSWDQNGIREVVSRGIDQAAAACKSSAAAFIFCGFDTAECARDVLREHGFTVKPAAWMKTCPPPAGFGNWWPSAFELAMYAYRNSPWFEDKDPKRTNVFWSDSYRFGQPGKVPHPTQKPLELMVRIVSSIVPPGGLCIDPFMGSGSTIIACHSTGRHCIGIDLDANYLRIAQRRLERPHAHIPRPGRSESFPLWGE